MQIEFKNIYKSYGKTPALQDIHLKIESGALHFLLGPSGCGKTTALRLLAGLEQVTSGQILFDGKDVTNQAASDRGIGMVFQNYALWPHMTVLKNIEYGLKLRKFPKKELETRLEDVLEFTQLKRYSQRMPGQLSGGQQQRVALARALAIRPNVLLLDEPLSNLDAKLRLEMRENITRIHQETKITMVYVTHDQKEALSMGTSVSVLFGGKMIQTSSPRGLYYQPRNSFVSQFIGETNLLAGRIVEKTDKIIKAESPLGVLTSKNSSNLCKDLNEGDKIAISIRPETIGIDFDQRDTTLHHSQLQLKQLTYLGEQEQLLVSDNKDHFIKINLFNAPHHNMKIGDAVDCMFSPDSILFMPESKHLGPST